MGTKATDPQERRWDGLIRCSVDVVVKGLDEATRSVEVVASSEALDSQGDVVKQFWDLRRYKKNGPVLWNHNSNGSYLTAPDSEDLFPVGKGSNVRVEEGDLLATLTFGSKQYSDLSEKCFLGFKEGILKAVSVGFRPGSVKKIIKGDAAYYEIGDEKNPNELVEISVVPMGANPEAVAKSFALEREGLESLATKNFEDRAAASKPTAASGKDKQMDPELLKAIEAKTTAEQALLAEKAAGVALTEKLAKLEADLIKANTDLTAEKTAVAKLEKDLGTATTSLKAANDEIAKATLDGLQSVKFGAGERDELDKLVADIGIERVKALLSKRTDITLAQPVLVEGKPLETKAVIETPSADPSGDIASTATKNIAAA